MSDMKRAFENAGIKGPGGGGDTPQKKCRCGKPIRDPKFDTCYDCSQRRQGGGDRATQRLTDEYLKGGYFDVSGNIYEDLLTTMADQIAQMFAKAYPKLKNHQLRRFYQHTRAAENKLRMTSDWPSTNVDIKKLKSFVAEAKGKDKVPEVFYDFINRNIDWVKDEKSFLQGFLEHFQAVVAYFTFHHPKK